jgi:hypothetical protein
VRAGDGRNCLGAGLHRHAVGANPTRAHHLIQRLEQRHRSRTPGRAGSAAGRDRAARHRDWRESDRSTPRSSRCCGSQAAVRPGAPSWSRSALGIAPVQLAAELLAAPVAVDVSSVEERDSLVDGSLKRRARASSAATDPQSAPSCQVPRPTTLSCDQVARRRSIGAQSFQTDADRSRSTGRAARPLG